MKKAMSELELGQATIIYEDPEEGVTRQTLDNEQIVYVRDHWTIKAGTDEEGNDLMHQIPKGRVHRVERNVERFEEEASTIRHRLQTLASEVGEKLPVGGERESDAEDVEPIPVGTPDDEQ